VRAAALLLLALPACGASCLPRHRPVPPRSVERAERARPPDAVLGRVAEAIARGDLAGARAHLDAERWLAADRARAALLYFDLLLAEGRPTDATEALRAYLEKTPRPGAGRSAMAAKLLRHHATGGGLASESPEEALHFGLYALFALEEKRVALPDLERAAAGAPEPERSLARRFAEQAR